MQYLLAGKFRKCGGPSSLVDGAKEIYSSDPAIDTQSFAAIGNDIAVLHHQHHKLEFTPPVTFVKQSIDGLPDAAEIKFPSSLASRDNLLAVAANGQEFKGSIRIYELRDRALKRIAAIDLVNRQERPIGLAFSGDELLWASYSGQCVWAWNWKTTEVRLVVDVARYGQTTPIGILPLDGQVAVLGHVDGSAVFYETKYGLPTRIIRNGLCYPWGIASDGDNIAIGNRGDEVTEGYLLWLDPHGREIRRQPADGVTVVRA